MKTSELREKSLRDLNEMNEDCRRELFDLRFSHYTGQLIQTSSLKMARRKIARIETVIRERQIGQTASEESTESTR